MTSLTPAMEAALAQERALVTMFIEVMLPGHPLRLLVGAGAIAWGDLTFADVDGTFGVLAGLDSIEDGEGDEAPSFRFSMFPSSDATAAQLAAPGYQGSAVRVWLAAIHPLTGLLIPDPELLFSGLLDVVTLMPDRGAREVEFDCVSDFELLLEEDEGARLSDAFHQSIWPGETGFANVTGLERTIYWGVASPPASGGVTMGGFGGALGSIYRALIP